MKNCPDLEQELLPLMVCVYGIMPTPIWGDYCGGLSDQHKVDKMDTPQYNFKHILKKIKNKTLFIDIINKSYVSMCFNGSHIVPIQSRQVNLIIRNT